MRLRNSNVKVDDVKVDNHDVKVEDVPVDGDDVKVEDVPVDDDDGLEVNYTGNQYDDDCLIENGKIIDTESFTFLFETRDGEQDEASKISTINSIFKTLLANRNNKEQQ